VGNKPVGNNTVDYLTRGHSMPKVAAYTLAWSSTRQAYRLSEGRERSSLNIVPESPAWFAWLSQVPSFAFSGQAGSYTVRKETKHGDVYWYAYLRIGEKLTKKYVGKTTSVTIARLEHVAGAMSADLAAGTHTTQETLSHQAQNEADPLIAAGDVDAGVKPISRVPPGKRRLPLNPLLATKLHVPRPRGNLVLRPHLTQQLRQAVAQALTIVSAPAGSLR
jgi:LuxR family maltose regulon positive regulatory protein